MRYTRIPVPSLCSSVGPLLIFTVLPPPQVEAMKEVGVAFSSLVQELAALREVAKQGLDSLQAEHSRLEEEIRRVQERHQTVRAVNQDAPPLFPHN